MRLRHILRKLFSEYIECPWCEERLDTLLPYKLFKKTCPVLLTMVHAPLCPNYNGYLRRPVTKLA